MTNRTLDTLTLTQAKRMYLSLLVWSQQVTPALKSVIETPLTVNAKKLLECVAMGVYFNSGYTACETYDSIDEFKYTLIEELAEEFYGTAKIKDMDLNLYDFENLPNFELYPFKKHTDAFTFIGSRFFDLTPVLTNFANYPTNVRLSSMDDNLPDFDQEVLVKKYISLSLSILTDLKTLARAISAASVHKSFSSFKEQLECEDPVLRKAVEDLAVGVIPVFEKALKSVSPDFSPVTIKSGDINPAWIAIFE